MPTDAPKPVMYLGDGVYATFEGYYIKLEVDREGMRHTIYIEDAVMSALNDFAVMCWGGNNKGE